MKSLRNRAKVTPSFLIGGRARGDADDAREGLLADSLCSAKDRESFVQHVLPRKPSYSRSPYVSQRHEGRKDTRVLGKKDARLARTGTARAEDLVGAREDPLS
jgi:hypothetical protein